MRHRLKLILLEDDGGKSRPIIKQNVTTEKEMIEAFRAILQTYHGVPSKEIAEKFLKPLEAD